MPLSCRYKAVSTDAQGSMPAVVKALLDKTNQITVEWKQSSKATTMIMAKAFAIA